MFVAWFRQSVQVNRIRHILQIEHASQDRISIEVYIMLPLCLRGVPMPLTLAAGAQDTWKQHGYCDLFRQSPISPEHASFQGGRGY